MNYAMLLQVAKLITLGGMAALMFLGCAPFEAEESARVLSENSQGQLSDEIPGDVGETPVATPETPVATPETPVVTPETPVVTPETPVVTPETPVPAPEIPGTVDGAALYKTNCASCHGALATSTKRERNAMQLDSAIAGVPQMQNLNFLNSNERFAIAAALASEAGISCDNTIASFVNINRLTKTQYNNVIRDLTGLAADHSAGFPADGSIEGFTNIAAVHGIDQLLAEQYMQAGEKILDEAFRTNRNGIVTCNPGQTAMSQRTCAMSIIKDFGLKAFRRPLTADETTTFIDVYNLTRMKFPSGTNLSLFDESLKAPLLVMLTSPNFLFQIIDQPVDAGEKVKVLNGYELASRLSFTLWGSIPDGPLFTAAANGSLLTPMVLDQQVERMLADPKAEYLVNTFATQWLRLEKVKQAAPSKDVFPTFTPALKEAMLTESQLLLKDIILGNNSPYMVLEADYTYLNQALARHYGINGVTGTQFRKTSLANTGRAGLVTHGSVLSITAKATETSIVQRGLYLLENILCTHIGPAPANVIDQVIAEKGPLPTNPRQLALLHSNDNRCASCHAEIDPAGVGLENFGPAGQFRNQYPNGDAIDASGSFPGGQNFANYQEMSEYLGTTNRFKTCVSRKFMTFALGRALNEGDQCSADKIGVANVDRNKSFKEVLKSVITSDQFRKQKGE